MAIISLNPGYLKRSNFSEFPQEVSGTARRAGLVYISKGKSGRQVDGGKQIAFKAIYENINRVYLYQITGELGIETFPPGFLP